MSYLDPHWNNLRDGAKAYRVELDGVVIGKIEQTWPTFDRKPRGARIVTKRWETKRARWVALPPVRRGRSCMHETRKGAVADLVSLYEKGRGE